MAINFLDSINIAGSVTTSTNGDGFVFSSPTTVKFKLGVYGGNDLLFKDSNNGVLMVLTEAGKVGIGTTSPAEKLHVNGEVRVDGNDGVATKKIRSSYFSSSQNLDLQTGLSADVILTTRNVGIGTTTPVGKVEVLKNGGTSDVIITSDTLALLQLKDSGLTKHYNIELGRSASAGDLTFRSVSGEKVRFTEAGNVGIGTTSPDQALVVNGQIKSLGGGSFAAGVNFGGSLSLQNSITILNKAQTTYIPFATKNTSGSEVVMDLANIGSINGGAAGPYLALAGGTMTGNINFNDDVFARFGNGNDLEIGHDASNSYITHSGVGNLIIRNTEDNSDIRFQTDNGSGGVATYFTIDGLNEINQFSKNVSLPDNIRAKFGNSSDLQIYHDGSNSYIQDSGSGGLRVSTNQFRVYNAAIDELMINANEDGSVELYYNNAKKFETSNTGITITGNLDGAANMFLQDYIYHSGDGNTFFGFNGADDFRIYTGNTLKMIADADNVRLYYNGAQKFETTAGGTSITGTIDSTGTITVTGANGNVGINTDTGKLLLGASYDLQIYHDGSNSYIDDAGTGDLYIRANNLRLANADGSGQTINANNGGNVELFHNNSKKFETTSTGVTVTGAATATTFIGDLNGTINTATTAATQANATNNTTVATTAFVQNLIGTIPAGLVFQGTWDARTAAEGGAAGDRGNPALANGVGTTGNFYIVSNSGSVNLDGVTDWVTGDWAVFIEQGGTDAWEKIDNSSVLDGAGTGQKVALWSGSGTSNTLTDAPITVSGNNATFTGNVAVSSGTVTLGADVSIFRDGTNILRTDDKLHANNDIYLGGAGKIFDRADNSNYIELADTIIVSTNTAFAGSITTQKADNVLLVESTNAGQASLDLKNTEGHYRIITDAGEFKIFDQTDSRLPFLIDTSGNATFAGNVVAGNNAVQNGANPGLEVRSTNTSQTVLSIDNTTTRNYELAVGGTASSIGSGSFYIYDGTAASARLVIDTSGNATFAGTINSGSITSTGIITAATTFKSDSGSMLFFVPNVGQALEIAQNTGKATFSGSVTVANSSPSLSLTDTDNNTNIAFSSVGGVLIVNSASDQIYQIGAAEKMRIDSAGNVGIGKTAQSGFKLDVEGNVITRGSAYVLSDLIHYGASDFSINASNGSTDIRFLAGSTEKMRIKSGGNVGIGTTNPGTKLTVEGDTKIQKTGNADTFLTLNPYYGGLGTTYQWNLVGTNSSNNYQFQIREGSTTYLTIGNSAGGDAGNVGINTTNPTYKLSVNGGIDAGGKITYTKSAGSLNTTGYAVAGITAIPGGNGFSCGFTFTCFGGEGKYQKLVYSCYNSGGTWNVKKVIDEGTNDLDIVANTASGSTITFTFKAKSSSQSFTPRVTVEGAGTGINTTYA